MVITMVIMTMLMIMLAACWGQAVAARARTCHSCPWTSENDETDAGCWTYEHLNIWTSGEHLTLMRLRMDVVHLKIWWTSETEHLIIVDGATDDMIWWWQCYLCENLAFNEYTVWKNTLFLGCLKTVDPKINFLGASYANNDDLLLRMSLMSQ